MRDRPGQGGAALTQHPLPSRVLRSIAAALLLALALPTDASAWWNTSWSQRRKLTFANPRAENLTGFQVLVVLNSTRIDYTKTRNDGFDLRFVDSDDGTLLDYEIEGAWNEAGNSYVWVRVPTIDASSSADFVWLYYGNASASTNVQNAGAVWAGYSMVQHLDETSGTHFDSTGNGNHSAVIDVQAQGAAGVNGGDTFSSVGGEPVADNVDVPDSATLDMGAGESSLIEAWVRTTTNGGYRMVVSKENFGVGTQGEIQLGIDSSNNAHFWLRDGVGGVATANSGGAILSGTWRYLVGRWNEATATAEVFLDGVSVGSASNALAAVQTATPLVIGQEGDSDRGYGVEGGIDEVRVWKSAGPARSDLWIDAQWDSMRDTGAGLVGPFVSYASATAQCCGLGVTETATTITVTAPSSFEIGFNTATGGGADRFVDGEEGPTDLAGGTDFQEALFTHETSIGGQNYTTGQNSEGVTLDLLEATPARVKVRQMASYTKDSVSPPRMAGIKGFGDYSIYGIGRMAIGWETRATVNTDSNYTQLQFSVTYAGGSPPWTGYTDSFGPLSSPFPLVGNRGAATDGFVLLQIEQPGARTDFLSILSQNWALANSTWFGVEPAVWEEAAWNDDNFATFLANSRTRFNFLTYFKPTNFTSGGDTAVASRAFDYRTPSTTVVSAGAGWVDTEEKTAADPANVFFNEAEAAYVFDLDPSLGLSFAMDGGANTRYSPFFKIRRWRSFVETPIVTFDADGPGGAAPVALVKDVDYRAALKPFARAHRASILAWHCSLQDASACTPPGLDVGNGGSITGGAIVPGRFGNGLDITGTGDNIQASISDFSQGAGSVEFWFRPDYDSTDAGAHMLWSEPGASAPYDCFRFEHTGGNLVFQVRTDAADGQDCSSGGTSSSTTTVTGASYVWSANEWVHLRTDWNNGTGLRVFLNGRLVGSSGAFSTVGFQAGQTYFGGCNDVGLVCPGGGGARFANGIIDEPTIYEGLGAAGNPEPLAHGGLATDASEYLARADLDLGLLNTPVAAGSKGTYLFFGADSRFSAINMSFETLGVGASVAAGALVWEYWSDNGAGAEAWSSLETIAGFNDGTNDFKQRGVVSWSPTDASLANWKPYSVNGGPELFYVRVHLGGVGSYTTTPVENVFKTDILLFQYCKDVTAAGQTFTFGVPTTVVRLMSFAAVAGDGSATLEWQTGSELSNLGFHLYRGPSADGPWTRLTSSLIPGLGSSPLGQAYSWQDTGLRNGVRYYYQLEDVDTASRSTFHGPVSTVPVPASSPPGGDGDGDGGGDDAERGGGEPVSGSCPSWILAAAPDAVSPTCTRHGDPDAVSLQVLARDASSATVELRTPGFWTLREGAGEVQGEVRIFVPGFDLPTDPKAPALPLRRALVPAVIGKQVHLVSAEAFEVRSFPGLRPSAVGQAELAVRRDGTVRPSRRALPARFLSRGLVPLEVARLSGTAFQGERKSAVVEITPVRFSGGRDELVLAGRVRVKLAFAGVAEGESRTGDGGRTLPRKGLLRRGPSAAAHVAAGSSRGEVRGAVPDEPRGGCRRRSCVCSGRGRRFRSGWSRRGCVRSRGASCTSSRTVRRPRRTTRRRWRTSWCGGPGCGWGWRRPRRVGAPVVSSSTGFCVVRDEPDLPAGAAGGAGHLAVGRDGVGGGPDAGLHALGGGRVFRGTGTAGGVPAGRVGVGDDRRPPHPALGERGLRRRGDVRREAAVLARGVSFLLPCCGRGRTSWRSRTWGTRG